MIVRYSGPFLAAMLALPLPGIAIAAQAEQAPASISPHHHASAPQVAGPASPLSIPLDAATLGTLPRESVTANAHGRTLHCEGVALISLLRAADALPAGPLKDESLARYVLVAARDGYRSVYSLAELEPTLGNYLVLLVDQCEGKPLAAGDGPLRLVAPGDSRAARWVRQVQSITVVAAP